MVIDDVEDDRRLIGGGKDHCRVKIRLRRRTVADPGGRDFRIALDGRGHRPADGLHILRGEIA
ncbi:hypothetical protein D3C86_1510100 [compost metagenome]